MQALPFEVIQQINLQLADHFFPNLVAVFSKRDHRDLLLVYISTPLPKRTETIETMLLADLQSHHLRSYNGPVIAFSAIDAVHSDIPTKGTNFLMLANLLRQRGRFDLVRQTRYRLSHHLFDQWKNPLWKPKNEFHRHRLMAKIISFAVPQLLVRLPLQNLVAIIPDDDPEIFLNKDVCRLVYTHLPRPNLLPPGTTACVLADVEQPKYFENETGAVSMEEAWSGQKQAEFFPLELRFILRKNGLDYHLPQTISSLAEYFYRCWESHPHQLTNLQLAYALVAEKWLGKADADDLVAILPCNNFAQFMADGTAIYLYRQLNEPEQPALPAGIWRMSFEQLSHQSHLPDGYGRVGFSLFPLRTYLKSVGIENWQDMGSIFLKAGETKSLARNAWLLVRDLMDWSREQREDYQVLLPDLIQVIIHSCALFSLVDPWEWRQGRYSQMMVGVYDTLNTVFIKQAEQVTERTERLYYRALGLWYGCATTPTEKIETELGKMVGLLRSCESTGGRQSPAKLELKERIAHLQRVGNALLHMLNRGGQPEIIEEFYRDELKPIAGSVQWAIRQAADMATFDQTELPSLLFRHTFQLYTDIMNKIQKIRYSAIPLDEKIDQLQQRILDLEQARRIVFALYHETKILDLLYERAIQQTRTFTEDLRGSALLVVDIWTSSLAHYENNVLAFLVKNVGRVEARNVQAELVGSERFNLIEASSVKLLPNLPAETEKSVEFVIRPLVDDDFPLQLILRHEDPRVGIQEQRLQFSVRITSLDRRPFRPKPNPYIYGVPLQDHRFFYGRRQELEALLNHLASGRPQNVLLQGARRTGKTSILNMLKNIIEDSTDTSQIRLQLGIPSEWYAALNKLQPVLLDMQSLERKRSLLTATEFYQAILAGLMDIGLGSGEIERLLTEPYVTVNQIERVLAQTVREHHIGGLVLLLDEFDLLDLIADKSFYAHLRHIISHVQTVTWIITSALGLYKEVRDYESPLFNVFKIIAVGRLDREAARQLILAPWQPISLESPQQKPGLHFMDDAMHVILNETGCHPYFIQLLCSTIVEHVNLTRTNYVLSRTVYEVIEKLIEPRSAAYEHFAYFWDRADGMGKAILLLLLSRTEPLTPEALQDIIQQRLAEPPVNLPAPWLVIKYNQSLLRLQAVEAVIPDNANRLMFGIPLFRQLLIRRSQRENLWESTVQLLQTDYLPTTP